MKSGTIVAMSAALAVVSIPSASAQVRNADIRPRWILGGKALWYQADGENGKRAFWRVTAATGKKEPAFDHARLAQRLHEILKQPADPDKLPIDALTFAADGKTIFFLTGGTFWRCLLSDYSVSEFTPDAGDAAPEIFLPAEAPTTDFRTRRNGGATLLLFVNQSGGEVALFWVDEDGKRHEYGKIRSGETRRMNTYSGHAFLIVGADNKLLRGFVAADDFKVALIPAQPLAVPEKKSEETPDVSPDGKRTIFVRERNLFLRDNATGKETVLTANGVPDNFYDGPIFWSPDSKKIIAFRNTPAQEHKVTIVDSSPADQVQPRLLVYDYLKPGDRIAQSWPHLFDISTGKEIPVSTALFPNPWELSETRWSPDASAFTFLYNQRGHQIVRLIRVEAKTGAAQIIAEENSKTFVDYPNKIWHHFLDKTGEMLWMSERDGWNHLYLLDATTGALKRQLTKGAWIVRSVESVDEKAKQIIFRAGGKTPGQDPYYLHYCRVDFDGANLIDLTPGDGMYAQKLNVSPDGKFFVDSYSRVDMPPVTELRRISGGKLVCELERGDGSALIAAGNVLPERFVARGRDGKTYIYGIILRPKHFDPSKKYPVIEEIYAGPHGQHVPKSWAERQGGQDMADLGFIVVRIDGMGTNWRSKAFHDVCWKNLADAGFPDRILWIKSAAAKYPQMDIARGVGIYGGSAGGQNAMRALIDHHDFYTVAVADCGCHDNRMDKIWWNELWMGWPVDDSYIKSSNVADAPKMQGKLLLIVGELDTNVDPASTTQMVNALIKADKDFDFLLIPGAGHGAAGTPYGRRRQQKFFVDHLLDEATRPPEKGGA